MARAKHLIQQAVSHLHHPHHHNADGGGGLAESDLDIRAAIHYGVPSTASLLAFDDVQRLLAVATRDGRIKVIGGDGIEALLVSPKPLPYKYLEFLENQGYLIGISNEDEIQVWNLRSRCLECCLQWESTITAFAVMTGSYFMYIGDEFGSFFVVTYVAEEVKLVQLPYQIAASSILELAGLSSPDHQTIVGILPQLCSSRVLIAYQSGTIILWDVSEAQILFVGGGKDLQLKNETIDSQNEACSEPDIAPNSPEKEITSLCWASTSGSILAVGYLDGDVLFWKIPSSASSKDRSKADASKDVVKLQLSAVVQRIPVIVMHWSESRTSASGSDGQLFIYGGDHIGSEEVLTVLTLEWSSGLRALSCSNRVDVRLSGSFADMILVSSHEVMVSYGRQKDAFFLLTNPGLLQFYDETSLSALLSQKESKEPIFNVNYPAVVPTSKPPITVTKLATLPAGVVSPKLHHEKSGCAPARFGGSKWPLSGGVPSQLSFIEKARLERVYMVGYQNGTVRLWNANSPIFYLISFAESEVHGLEVAGFDDPVSSLEFCFSSLTLAAGNLGGMVRIYKLGPGSNGTRFHLVMESKVEDQIWPQQEKPYCQAVFSLINSPVCVMQFANSGASLAVGYECGRVLVLDMSSLSVLFSTDSTSGSKSPVISLHWTEHAHAIAHVKGTNQPGADCAAKPQEKVLFILTKDATLNIVDGGNGRKLGADSWRPKNKVVAISMHIIETSHPGSMNGRLEVEPDQVTGTNSASRPGDPSTETTSSSGKLDGVHTGDRLSESFLILCCEESLRLYSTKNVIQGKNKAIYKVKHSKRCCWTSIFKKDDKVVGVFLLFYSGAIEIRSFPELNLVTECSLMSTLRWSFEANMERMMSFGDGEITLANGCEFACILLLLGSNSFRIPESLPCLYDEVLAAAAFSLSAYEKKKQASKGGIIGGLVKGLKGAKANHTSGVNAMPKTKSSHLEGVFSKPPFSDSSSTPAEDKETTELDIDDIEVDKAPISAGNVTSKKGKTKKKGTEREQLLGIRDDEKPRLRTQEEIMTQYRFAGDASAAASHARKKLAERQEKLEGIQRRTAELQSGAEDFASMANELVKVMENRKWWQI